MDKKILINARHPEEKRVAIVEGGRLTDFYVETAHLEHLRGNIYKGAITALERGLQAAFVDFGPKKQGFLPLREVMPESYKEKPKGKVPQIREVLSKGQDLMVQVEQDQRGTKGAGLTNYISIPGRYIVMMPGRKIVGVSRKIEDKASRDRMKEAFQGLKVPKDMGFILRTAGVGRTTEQLAADLKYLMKLWTKIKRDAKAKAPALIYKEQDIAVRTVRDYLTEDVDEVLVDDADAYKAVKAFLKLTMPWRSINVVHYKEKTPLFEQYDLEEQIAGLSEREVFLPSGGAIVIDRTEALTAIDVNSARSKKDKDVEAMALRTNIEAADEAARQLRLRDIGGLIVIDFIDMEVGKNRQAVEDRLTKALDLDKAHYDIARISRFGMLEMTRERMRTAYFEASVRRCPSCGGRGVVKTPELLAVSALRALHSRASGEGVTGLTCRMPVDGANHLMNKLRDGLAAIEKEFSIRINVLADPAVPPGEFVVEAEGAEPARAHPERHVERARAERYAEKPHAEKAHAEKPAAEREHRRPEHPEPRPEGERKSRRRRGRRRPFRGEEAQAAAPAAETGRPGEGPSGPEAEAHEPHEAGVAPEAGPQAGQPEKKKRRRFRRSRGRGRGRAGMKAAGPGGEAAGPEGAGAGPPEPPEAGTPE